MTFELFEKAWREVGKFIWAFTNVERGLDQLLVELFELNPISEEIFLNSLDLRKKINIAEVALNYQFYKHQLGRLHKLHDIRNNIAHRAFLPLSMEIEGKASEGKKDGISF